MTPVSCSRHHGSSAAANSRRIAENGGCSVSTWPTRLGRLELRHVVVRQPDGAHLSLRLEVEQRAPILLDRRSVLGRPVHLVEVDAVEAEPAAASSRARGGCWRGAPTLLRQCLAVVLVPGEAALGEHVGALRARDLLQRRAHDLLGVPEAVDRGGVDPVDAALDRVADRGDRLPVVLRAPARPPNRRRRWPRRRSPTGVMCMSVRPKRRLGSAPLFAPALSE